MPVIEYTFNLTKLQEEFGKRPGDYLLDPYWFRQGMGNKPYLWDAVRKKWLPVRKGDKFDFDEDGNVVKVDE